MSKLAALFLFALTLSFPSSSRAEDVYWTTKSLLKDFFKTSKRVTYVKLDKARERAAIAKRLGHTPKRSSYVVFIAKTGDRVDGYAVVDEEMGQHQPITFGVKISPDGKVERLEVMVYREGYGDEIREGRFRRQFEGKSKQDDLRFGTDVVAISGATISSKAMAVGVRRAVALAAVAAEELLAAAPGSGAAVAAR